MGPVTYIQTWTALGSPSLTAIWSLSWERVLGSGSTPWVRPQAVVSGAPAYNPRSQTDIIISLCAKMHLWFNFNFYNAVYFTWWVIRLLRCGQKEGSSGQVLRDLRDSKTHSFSYLKCHLTCCARRQARNLGSVQVGQRPAPLLVKPEVLHFNFPNGYNETSH